MGNPSKFNLDWATHEAAKHACECWHYSRCLPTGKLVKVGVWEDGKYKGVVIFSRGASPYLGKKWDLPQTEICELTRIALKDHVAPVSKILAVALRFLNKFIPGMRIVVSFADPDKGHHGGIYQASNWIYTGLSASVHEYFINGKWMHLKGAHKYVKDDRSKYPHREKRGKYRYLWVFDKKLLPEVEKSRKDYPTVRHKHRGPMRPAHQPGEGSSNLTVPLHS